MADPLSVTASVLAVTSAAIVSVRSLCDTIKRFQERDKTLQRLRTNLQDLVAVLVSLGEAIKADTSVLVLLESPVDRCTSTCAEFELTMKAFHQKSKTGLLDWAKLEFRKGDINDFSETIERFKSTITVGLGTINLRHSQASRDVLHDFEEMVKDTMYDLKVHLQRIDEKLAPCGQDTAKPDTSIDLQNEKAVTQQCLRICRDASSYIDSLATREPTLRQSSSLPATGHDLGQDFEAQVLMRQAFNSSQATFTKVIHRLGERLESVVLRENEESETERSRLQEDLRLSNQLLQVCKAASEISRQKIHRVGEAVTDEDSDQVVVNTFADLFEVQKASSKGRSAQLVASLTPDNFDHVVEKRYNSRFGTRSDQSESSRAGDMTSPVVPSLGHNRQFVPGEMRRDVQLPEPSLRRDKPNPNEIKKRSGDSIDERKRKPPET